MDRDTRKNFRFLLVGIAVAIVLALQYLRASPIPIDDTRPYPKPEDFETVTDDQLHRLRHADEASRDRDLEKLLSYASNGHRQAQYYVGQLFHDGKVGWRPDYCRSNAWLLKAAQQGHRDALRDLSEVYLDGSGVSASEADVAKWHVRANHAYNAGQLRDDRTMDVFLLSTYARLRRVYSEADLQRIDAEEAAAGYAVPMEIKATPLPNIPIVSWIMGSIQNTRGCEPTIYNTLFKPGRI
jgi:TPR repeat protein